MKLPKNFNNPASYFLLAILAVLTGCISTDEKYPEIPHISFSGVSKFKDGQGKDSALTLKINYTDGDGNIGLTPSDSFPPFNFGSRYFYNLYVDYLIKENGTFRQVQNDSTGLNQRVPMLTPEGKSKSINGEIAINFNASVFPGLLPDTIKCRFFLIDRDLNESNTVESPEIFLNH